MFLSTNLSHIRSKDRRYSAGKMSRESDIPRRFTGAFQAAQIESPPRSVKSAESLGSSWESRLAATSIKHERAGQI